MTSTDTRTAWQRTTARQRTLQHLTAAVEKDPASLPEAVRTALDETYDSLDELIGDAHAQWVRTFDAQADLLLETGAWADQAASDALWWQTSRRLRGLALLLQAYAAEPALVRAHAQHAQRVHAYLGTTVPSTWLARGRDRTATPSRPHRWTDRARTLLAH